MQVFGYVRFSYMGRSDTRMSRVPSAGPDDYFQRLFDPLRMEKRFHFFEKICLPSIKAQSDQDFTILILASQDMPDPYKVRLAAAVSDIPQVRICYSDAQHILRAFRPFESAIEAELTEKSVHFRLDDDDAIAADLISNLREMASRAEPGTLLSLPRGFHLFAYQGRSYLLPKFEQFIAIGLARVCGPGKIRNPYYGAHREVFRFVPSMIEPRKRAYIHVAHAASDTHAKHNRRVKRLLESKPDVETAEHQDKLKASFADAFPDMSFDDVCATILSAPDSIADS